MWRRIGGSYYSSLDNRFRNVVGTVRSRSPSEPTASFPGVVLALLRTPRVVELQVVRQNYGAETLFVVPRGVGRRTYIGKVKVLCG